MKSFSALICGYGVPKNIDTDPNYQAYLHPVVNYLFRHHRNTNGTIVLNGGATDIFKPYKRTEAGEMKKWLQKKVDEIRWPSQNVNNGILDGWQVLAKPKALTTVETLLNFAKTDMKGLSDILIFCEATRAARIRRLVREIPSLRSAETIPIDFDTSPRRYDLETIKKNERDFLQLELAALHNPTGLKSLRTFAQEKLRLMRQYTPEEAHRRLPEILKQLHSKFRK